MVMKDFKQAKTLHEEYSKKPKPANRGRSTPSFRKSKTHKCEHHNHGVCGISREAVKLGLREDSIICTGNIPPDCKIRQDLEAGKTIQELFNK